ncbi:MAG: PD40 domain-containing protein [Chloroflexi bacterium]|nr:PD40 domain-containing protein [Chloroflexota bacterium]
MQRYNERRVEAVQGKRMVRWLAGLALRLFGGAVVLCAATLVVASASPGMLITFESEVVHLVQRQNAIAADIFLMDAARNITVNASDHPAHDTSASWSPDGTQMAFYSTREQGIRSLYLMSADGTIRRAAPQEVRYGYHPAWSPDSTRIAFEVDVGAQTDLYILDVTQPLEPGKNPSVLADHLWDDRFPSWSPDGQWLAFVSWRDGNADIFRARADGSEVRNLTQDPAWDISPSWSPDGQSIAFFSVRSLYRNLFVMKPDGGDLRQLTDTQELSTGTFWHAPAWSPDGSMLAIQTSIDRDNEIVIVGRDGAPAMQLTRAGRSDVLPAWLPDGERLLFMSDRGGRFRVYVAEWRTQRIQSISPADMLAVYPSVWVPSVRGSR